MLFSFVSAFNNLIKPYFKDSILKKAIKNNLIKVKFYDIRDFSDNKYNKIDSPLCGGGAGLIFSPHPLFDCLEHIKNKQINKNTQLNTHLHTHLYAKKLIKKSNKKHKNKQIRIIFLTPQAPLFSQKDAIRLSKTQKHIVFVSSRYQGIDERVIEKYGDEVFSIGEYVLTGGELPSLVLCDAIARNIKGVLGNKESLKGESYGDNNLSKNLLAPPTFCKPLNVKGFSVPNVLLSGDHKKIANYKKKLSLAKTKYYYPNK